MELKKLVVDCKRAINRLHGYIEYNKIDIKCEIDLEQIREWFLIMQGYAECMEEHEIIK